MGNKLKKAEKSKKETHKSRKTRNSTLEIKNE